ncbi:MAG: phenylalanine--tRNA ligase subunit beta [Euryarchaeota archaeon]|nr:phenylalanine--tRNA ligase subunit beta [Euryarchaeota archaeon]
MTVVEFEHEEFLDLVGARLTSEEVEAKVSMMGCPPEGIQGTLQRFDINPNRPDWLSIEGIARAFRGVLGLETGLPRYDVRPSGIVFEVDASVKDVRPHAVGAIVRDVEFTEPLLKSLIELQENLHLTHGRRRKKVAIGIHDVDKVRPPFVYKAVPPKSVKFVPLGMAESVDLAGILERHEKGREYGPLVKDKDRYPIILDRDGQVLSFPPVINGIVTQLSPETRNLFLDVTGTDQEAVEAALNIVCAALADRGARIESVELRTPDGTRRTPDLTPRDYTVDVAATNALLGLSLTSNEMADCLRRMRHDAEPEGIVLRVRTPAYRADILHPVDLMEDVAIGYGYDRFPTSLPRRHTSGFPSDLAQFTNALRTLMVGYGYQEIMSLTVAPPEEPFESPSRLPIRNPVATEQARVRSSLLPSLLGILALNKHRDLPQRVFEVGDAVRGAGNVRLLAGASIHARAGFTEVKSLVQGILRDVGEAYEIESAEDPNFIDGRCASVRVGEKSVGLFGEIHPRVVTGYELGHPVVAFELEVAALR